MAKKFGPLFENFVDKRIVLIDDSIVRGNTMGSIVRLLKRFGAKEVGVWELNISVAEFFVLMAGRWGFSLPG